MQLLQQDSFLFFISCIEIVKWKEQFPTETLHPPSMISGLRQWSRPLCVAGNCLVEPTSNSETLCSSFIRRWKVAFGFCGYVLHVYLSVLVVCLRLHCAGEMVWNMCFLLLPPSPLFFFFWGGGGGGGALLLVFMVEALHLVFMVDLKNKYFQSIFCQNSETPFSVYCKCYYTHLYSSLSDIVKTDLSLLNSLHCICDGLVASYFCFVLLVTSSPMEHRWWCCLAYSSTLVCILFLLCVSDHNGVFMWWTASVLVFLASFFFFSLLCII